MGFGTGTSLPSKNCTVVCVWMSREMASGVNQIPFGRVMLTESVMGFIVR
jgi:hypothetical protein